MNRPAIGALALLLPIALAGCTSPAASPTATGTTTPSAGAGVTTRGTYAAVPSATSSTSPTSTPTSTTSPIAAYTYDAKLVPPGATSEVTLTSGDGKTTVKLTVTGLVAGRAYGAHLHTNPCGADPKAAGPHFQHHADPVASQSPSVDPKYANPENEVWLDFTTDTAGRATVTATEPWVAAGDRQPRSLVIHAETTQTAAGKAGTAGARVGCLTLNR